MNVFNWKIAKTMWSLIVKVKSNASLNAQINLLLVWIILILLGHVLPPLHWIWISYQWIIVIILRLKISRQVVAYRSHHNVKGISPSNSTAYLNVPMAIPKVRTQIIKIYVNLILSCTILTKWKVVKVMVSSNIFPILVSIVTKIVENI